jgi:hypothetical protein
MTFTTSSTSLLISALIIVAVKNCRAFKHFNVLNVMKVSSVSRCYAANRDFIHESEYPGDDFSHILGKFIVLRCWSFSLVSTASIIQAVVIIIFIVIIIIITIICAQQGFLIVITCPVNYRKSQPILLETWTGIKCQLMR